MIKVVRTAKYTRRRRRRKKTGAGDSLYARLNNTLLYAYSNEDFTVISLRLPVP